MSAASNKERAGVLLDIGGAPVDLADVCWQEIAPCGCVCGLATAYMPGKDGWAIITPNQAAQSFETSAAERKKSERQGFTWRPQKWGVAHDELKAGIDCPHMPKYGVPKRASVDGYEWAVGGYWQDRTRVQHLVPVISVKTEDVDPDRGHWTAASLCGVTKRHWSNEWHATEGRIECRRCETKAEARP